METAENTNNEDPKAGLITIPPCLILGNSDGFWAIPYHEILKIEADNSQILVHPIPGSTFGEKISFSVSLKVTQEMLNPVVFFRCHNSWLINLEYFCHTGKGDNKGIIMRYGSIVPFSDSHTGEIEEAVRNYYISKH